VTPTSTRPGIALVAPAGYAPDPEAIPRAIARLTDGGFAVHTYYEHDARHERFGGTDAARLAQLAAAADDPDVHVVMAVRGGYGMTRLLPHIDFDRMAASGKLFVGYSDITAFHMALHVRGGTNGYAGPFAAGDFGAPEADAFTLGDFARCLAGPTHTVAGQGAAQGSDAPPLDVSGPVWGGNLAMTVSLLGTPYFPRIDGGILFLEDIGEHPYRVERMLLQLMHAGVLGRQRALVLGDFSGYRLTAYDNGYDFERMLAYLRATLPLPVLTGLEFGHIPRRVTIPFGAQGRLVAEDGSWRLTLSGYPSLQRG
jgi:muramoyltetrapeptide carboxypeptidase